LLLKIIYPGLKYEILSNPLIGIDIALLAGYLLKMDSACFRQPDSDHRLPKHPKTKEAEQGNLLSLLTK